MVHSVANIRRTFRPRGFAKHHAFTHSSWFASAMFVRNGLFGPGDVSASEPPGKLDWAGVQQMVGGIFYGGSINDDWDQRIFTTMCKQWLTPRLLEPGAVGDMEAGRLQKNLQAVGLVREVETHMQSLNRGRGLGFSLMGVQLNPRALGTVMMAAASAALTFKRVLADQEAHPDIN